MIAAIVASVRHKGASPDLVVSGGVGIVLFAMALWLIVESAKILIFRRGQAASA